MLKGVLNLFLVFIICITASGMFVDNNALDFLDYTPTFDENSQISYSVGSQDLELINPETISFTIGNTTPTEVLTPDEQETFSLDIFNDYQKISTYSLSDIIISQEMNNDTEIIMDLDISASKLNLQDGQYVFKLYSTHKKFSEISPLELTVKYTVLSPYMAASNNMPRGQMSLELYFPDKSNNYLVPITRFVNYSTAVVRTTVNNLHTGSQDFGFGNPIPEIPRLQVSNSTLTVYLDKDLEKYNNSSDTGYFALNSIVNSLTAVPGVDRVKFLVNGRGSEDFFHGYNTKTLFEGSSGIPKAYLATNINENRSVLVPVDLPYFEKSDLSSVFSTLKKASYNDEIFTSLFPTVSSDIELLSASIENNTVILNLSKDLLYSYPEREDLQKLMIDSILFSYCSISGIEKVQLLVDNQVINEFAGIELSQPVSKPKYINPEKE